MSWSDLEKGCSSPGLDIGDSPSVLRSPVTVSPQHKQKAGKVERKREQRCAVCLWLRQDNIIRDYREWARPARLESELLFSSDTDSPLLPCLAHWGAPVTSLEPRGQHSECPLSASTWPRTGRQSSVLIVYKKSASSSTHRRFVVRVWLQSDLDTPRLHHGDRELDTD